MALPNDVICPGDPVAFIAGEALAANLCVFFSAAATVKKTTATTDIGVGFVRSAAASGARVDIIQSGITWGMASAAIAQNAIVVGTAGGKLVTLPASTGTYYAVGYAVNAAAADTELFPVLVSFFAVYVA